MGEDKPFLPRGLIPGRGTTAHIRGRDPAATLAVLLPPKSRGRAPVFGEKGGGGLDQILKKSRTVKRTRTHLDLPRGQSFCRCAFYTRADAGKAGRLRRWYGHVRSGNGYGRGLPKGGGGRRTGVRGRRKEAEEKKETYHGRVWAGHRAGRGRTRRGSGIVWRSGGRGGGWPPSPTEMTALVSGWRSPPRRRRRSWTEVGGDLGGLGGQGAPDGGRGRGAGRLRAGEGGARTRRRASHIVKKYL